MAHDFAVERISGPRMSLRELLNGTRFPLRNMLRNDFVMEPKAHRRRADHDERRERRHATFVASPQGGPCGLAPDSLRAHKPPAARRRQPAAFFLAAAGWPLMPVIPQLPVHQPLYVSSRAIAFAFGV